MKSRITSWLGASALLLTLPGAALAAPSHVTYTGELMAENGLPYTGSVDVMARLYGAASGGTAVWAQDLGAVSVMGGVLQADLMGPELMAALGASSELWIEFEIEGETLAPRQKLSAVPYAAIAGNAAMLGGLPAGSYLTGDALGDALQAGNLPTDGINQISNGSLRNEFMDVLHTWPDGPIPIPDFDPSKPGNNAMATLDTAEGAGSYLTGLTVYTGFTLTAVSQVTVRLYPPASSGVPPIDLLQGQFLPSQGPFDHAWTVATTPEFGALLGQQVAGEWTLTITDTDLTLADDSPIGQLTTFAVTYDVVRANHLEVSGRLDVTGDLNVGGSVTAQSFHGDGKGLTGISRILNVTAHTNSTRWDLPASADLLLEEFTVEKISPTSMLIVQAVLSGRGEFSDHIQPVWEYAGVEVNGQQYPSDNGDYLRGKNTSQQVVFTGVQATGAHPMRFRFRSASGGGQRPFWVYNPNSSDDNRLTQTTSTFLVWEVEQ